MSVQGVKQFRAPAHGRDESFLSYCVWDRESRAALFVDAQDSLVQDYVDFASQNGLKPLLCADTQLHQSHPSGSRALAQQFRIPQFAGRGGSKQELELGGTRLSVLPTPGVAGDACCILGEGFILTGETLWVGTASAFGSADSDLPRLWKSLRMLKELVNPDALVFPGFDALGLCFSTWRSEMEKNPDLLARSEEELARLKSRSPSRAEALEVQSNRHSSISAEKLHSKLSSSRETLLFDIREPAEFSSGHIPGARNIPLSEIPFHLTELGSAARLYLYCQSSRRSLLAAATLGYIGFRDIVVLTGGFQTWQNAGYPVAKESRA